MEFVAAIQLYKGLLLLPQLLRGPILKAHREIGHENISLGRCLLVSNVSHYRSIKPIIDG